MINGNVRIVIAPYLPAFNDELKEEKDKVSKIYGEIMHEVELFTFRIQTLFKLSF